MSIQRHGKSHRLHFCKQLLLPSALKTAPMSSEDSSKFAELCASKVNNTLVALNLLLGQRLQLFQVLGDITNEQSPKSSLEIAQAARLKERYVREWLQAMVCGDIVQCDSSGTQFWLGAAKVQSLCQPLGGVKFMPMFAKVIDSLSDCFRVDGPNGISYDEYTELHDLLDKSSTAYCAGNLFAKIIPQVPLLDEKLKTGINVLDIGCGSGSVSRVLAKLYPSSQFCGVDFGSECIERARSQIGSLPNVSYCMVDAADLNSEWANKFEYVTAMDAIHDQAYPDRVLAEAFRVLKNGAYFSMIDIAGTSNCYDDKTKYGMFANFGYTVSLFHCMPVSLYFDKGLGLGAMWGQRLATQMLNNAGFEVLSVHEHDDMLHYVCRKPE